MKNWNIIEPHLVMQGISLSPGAEWRPQSTGWLFIQVRSGIGYCLEKHLNMELTTGAVLVLSQKLDVSIRASQLDGMNLSFFRVVPELLTGLISLGEQPFFQSAETRCELSHQLLAPDHPVSIKFKELHADRNRRDFLLRLKMLELFAQAFGEGLQEYAVAEVNTPLDARERLRQFLGQTLASEWLNLSFAELVQRMNCTPRHLSRIFRDIAGMSFREKQAKIRLARASELLVTTESKVVDVALDSGFQSLSLFNLMFRRRFGLSPGRWRKERQNHVRKISSQRKLVLIE
jgi:AraC-like DNA-binding protein